MFFMKKLQNLPISVMNLSRYTSELFAWCYPEATEEDVLMHHVKTSNGYGLIDTIEDFERQIKCFHVSEVFLFHMMNSKMQSFPFDEHPDAWMLFDSDDWRQPFYIGCQNAHLLKEIIEKLDITPEEMMQWNQEVDHLLLIVKEINQKWSKMKDKYHHIPYSLITEEKIKNRYL